MVLDYLVNLPESEDLGKAVNLAMEKIEAQSEQLIGVLPKEYTMFTNDILAELLRNGAIAVASGEDVMAEYTGIYPEKLSRAAAPAPVTQEKPAQKPAVSKKLKEKTIDNGPSRPYSEQNDALAGLSPLERAIMAAIGNEIAEVDDVIARVGLSTGEVLGTLTMLEIKKRILRHPGKRVSRLG